MIMVGAMAAALWGIGAAMGAPRQARWIMIGLLIVAVMIVQIVLPDGHPLRQATGGDVRFWLLLIGLLGLGWAYSQGLGKLRLRADEKTAPPIEMSPDKFSETELDRYARHVVLREIGGPGQKALKKAKVLVIGAGGLGSPALQYLAAAGVGTIGVIDDDVVENTNLQRQVIHNDERIGMPKVQSAFEAMTAQNPFVTVHPYNRRLSAENVKMIFADPLVTLVFFPKRQIGRSFHLALKQVSSAHCPVSLVQ